MQRRIFGFLMVMGLFVGLGTAFAQEAIDAGSGSAIAAVGSAVGSGSAVIAPTPPSPDNAEAFIQTVFDAVMNKNWMWAGALALIAAVWFIRKFGAKKIPFLGTDHGGAVLVMVTSILGAVATTLGAGKSINVGVLRQAVMIGFMGAGGWTWVKKMTAAFLKTPDKAPDAPTTPPAS